MFVKLHSWLRKNNISVFRFYFIVVILFFGVLWNDPKSDSKANVQTGSVIPSWSLAQTGAESWANKIIEPKKEEPFSIKSHINTPSNKSNAKFVCHKAIEGMLKAPSTAKFPAIYDTQIIATQWIDLAKKLFPKDKHNQNTFALVTYVDSQNSFWAMIRTSFACLFEYDPIKKDWFLKNIVSGE